ncbi:MAG: hypothetical protein E6R03_14260 [Hyphomicrobiaceae bacterium]|nr:MAG: hypothetical protein E6R03_14260 [Hyphomicrobiaceae bacterium]
MIERIKTFHKGWRRRSLLLLDAAGCPPWLAQWRCRLTRKEQAAYQALTDALTDDPYGVDYDDDDEEVR